MKIHKQLKNIGKGIKFIAKHPLESLVIGSTLFGVGCIKEYKLEGDVTNKVAFFRGEKYNLAVTLRDKNLSKIFYIKDTEESKIIDPNITYLKYCQLNHEYFEIIDKKALRDIILSGDEIDSIKSFSEINSSYNPSVDDFINQNGYFYISK